MVKKIKHFKLENFKPEELQKIEDEINAFTTGWLMMYIVIYEKEE